MLALAAYVGISWYSAVSTKEAEAVVVVDGKEQGRYPLHQAATVEIAKAVSYDAKIIVFDEKGRVGSGYG